MRERCLCGNTDKMRYYPLTKTQCDNYVIGRVMESMYCRVIFVDTCGIAVDTDGFSINQSKSRRRNATWVMHLIRK